MQMVCAEGGASVPYALCAGTGARTESGYYQGRGGGEQRSSRNKQWPLRCPRCQWSLCSSTLFLGHLTHSHHFYSPLPAGHSTTVFILNLFLCFRHILNCQLSFLSASDQDNLKEKKYTHTIDIINDISLFLNLLRASSRHGNLSPLNLPACGS